MKVPLAPRESAIKLSESLVTTPRGVTGPVPLGPCFAVSNEVGDNISDVRQRKRRLDRCRLPAEYGAREERQMTEAEWNACADPSPMLGFLRGKASGRALRLFIVACARSRLPAPPDPETVRALATAERYADGAASRRDLANARKSLVTSQRDRVVR